MRNCLVTQEKDTAKRLLGAALYAAQKHRDQTRKDLRTPYINHPLGVANLLAEVGVTDIDTLIAALLHDVLEDTDTQPGEIESMFGASVLAIVLEVTDDKHLPKDERRRLQAERAASLSPQARLIRIADKISNIRDLGPVQPPGWSREVKLRYIDWAESVVANIRSSHPAMEKLFDDTIAERRRSLT